jgi:hypothetical protein
MDAGLTNTGDYDTTFALENKLHGISETLPDSLSQLRNGLRLNPNNFFPLVDDGLMIIHGFSFPNNIFR